MARPLARTSRSFLLSPGHYTRHSAIFKYVSRTDTLRYFMSDIVCHNLYLKMKFKLLALAFAATCLAAECACPGSGRCCRCMKLNKFDNGQTACVADQAGAGDWGDDGNGLYFCKMKISQFDISELCHGNRYACASDLGPDRGYNCWDC
ncbi:hypothetical protein C2857_005424 [Epichloe festucae Fl1]|uniref:Uncharacterized protein n=1 Tax=Epichloe festucae (strain Fl1) TaxID=877507 RepID=A0A7S9KKY8_EPIFF|nr:hypothetical protein C2857_005424 [Epichloe festucae Fl1]